MQKLSLIGLIAVIAWQGYAKYQGRSMPPTHEPAETAVTDPNATDVSTSAEPSPAGSFKCDGRTHCSQMTSCAEATFFLRNCPGTKMDGDNDGIPCEQQWCS